MKITIREPGSAITHLIGMILAAAATTPLLIKSALAGGSTLMALSIFCLSMVLLYGASTVYHSVNLKGSALKISKIDHMMILSLSQAHTRRYVLLFSAVGPDIPFSQLCGELPL